MVTYHYQRILELWEGNIIHEHQALRLLLIIDHIFDWARDVYRRNIIDNLLSLAANPTPSLADDSEIYSTVGRFFDSDQVPISESASDIILEQTQPFGVPQLFKFFDTEKYALRDAKYMCHRFCAFHITLKNLDNFCYSVRSMKEAQQLARRLWKGIASPNTWSVTAECLDAAERLWTNRDRQLQTFQNPEEPFLACFEIKSYLSNGNRLSLQSNERIGQWDQIHQLTYIAIAHNAIELLRERTQLKSQYSGMRYKRSPVVPQERVINLLEQIRFATVKKCFVAAVSRTRLCSLASLSSRDKQFAYRAASGVRYFEPSFKQNNDMSFNAAELPSIIYKRLKVGMKEPSENFLRVSHQLSEQDLTARPSNVIDGWTEWDFSVQDYNTVLVAGIDTEDPGNMRNDRCVGYCLFVLDRLPKMPINDGVIGLKVYPRAILTYLIIRRVQRYNLPCSLWGPSDDLKIALKILENISNRYQVVQSLDRDLSEENLGYSFVVEKILGSWENPRWPYSFKDTVENIKQYGETCSLGQMLDCLTIAFTKVLEEQANQLRSPKPTVVVAKPRSTILLSSAKDPTISNPRTDYEAVAKNEASAINRVTTQPSSSRSTNADAPELIILDQPVVGVNYKRRKSQASAGNDAANSKQRITKRLRTQDRRE